MRTTNRLAIVILAVALNAPSPAEAFAGSALRQGWNVIETVWQAVPTVQLPSWRNAGQSIRHHWRHLIGAPTITGGSSAALARNMGATRRLGEAVHHLIPSELACRSPSQQARTASGRACVPHRVLHRIGIELDAAANGALVQGHHGSHPLYTQAVARFLDAIPANASVADQRRALNQLQEALRACVTGPNAVGFHRSAGVSERWECPHTTEWLRSLPSPSSSWSSWSWWPRWPSFAQPVTP